MARDGFLSPNKAHQNLGTPSKKQRSSYCHSVARGHAVAGSDSPTEMKRKDCQGQLKTCLRGGNKENALQIKTSRKERRVTFPISLESGGAEELLPSNRQSASVQKGSSPRNSHSDLSPVTPPYRDILKRYEIMSYSELKHEFFCRYSVETVLGADELRRELSSHDAEMKTSSSSPRTNTTCTTPTQLQCSPVARRFPEEAEIENYRKSELQQLLTELSGRPVAKSKTNEALISEILKFQPLPTEEALRKRTTGKLKEFYARNTSKQIPKSLKKDELIEEILALAKFACECCKEQRVRNDPSLVQCSSCPRRYHLRCLEPPLLSQPPKHWKCSTCASTADPKTPSCPDSGLDTSRRRISSVVPRYLWRPSLPGADEARKGSVERVREAAQDAAEVGSSGVAPIVEVKLPVTTGAEPAANLEWNPRCKEAVVALKSALHPASLPHDTFLCRQLQYTRLQDFTSRCVETRRVGSLYVCGPPGTGKTLALKKWAPAHPCTLRSAARPPLGTPGGLCHVAVGGAPAPGHSWRLVPRDSRRRARPWALLEACATWQSATRPPLGTPGGLCHVAVGGAPPGHSWRLVPRGSRRRARPWALLEACATWQSATRPPLGTPGGLCHVAVGGAPAPGHFWRLVPRGSRRRARHWALLEACATWQSATRPPLGTPGGLCHVAVGGAPAPGHSWRLVPRGSRRRARPWALLEACATWQSATRPPLGTPGGLCHVAVGGAPAPGHSWRLVPRGSRRRARPWALLEACATWRDRQRPPGHSWRPAHVAIGDARPWALLGLCHVAVRRARLGTPGGLWAPEVKRLWRGSAECRRTRKKGVQVVLLNCMALTDVHHVYPRLLEALAGETKAHALVEAAQHDMQTAAGVLPEVVALQKLLTGPAPTARRKSGSAWTEGGAGGMVMIILDEMDRLITREQDVLYHLLELPALKGSRVSLIGIANSIHLTTRLLPKLQARGWEPELLTFQAYTAQELKTLLMQRLSNLPWQGGWAAVVDPPALELLVRRISAAAGDMRRALDAMCAAFDTLVQESLSDESRIRVSVGQMAQALSQLLKSPIVDSVRMLPQNAQLVLCAAVQLLGRGVQGAKKQCTMADLHDSYNTLCREASLLALPWSEFPGLCSTLSDQALISIDNQKGGGKDQRRRRIMLKVDPDDVVFALKGLRFFRTLLPDELLCK
ncbi:AAA ATPase [Cymbomonas tetramitiformis]|uniref:AAA ATPase n=1 Tax=Cymbomonas tetramitiformis TaxID=36881 RepID=A0AAE0BSI7_9CHLO|nr:AAA ATPase [Cymbomonas tetramitiformis]